MVSNKSPVYSVGSANPVAFSSTYNTFSGIDIKLYAIPYKTETNKLIGSLQYCYTNGITIFEEVIPHLKDYILSSVQDVDIKGSNVELEFVVFEESILFKKPELKDSFLLAVIYNNQYAQWGMFLVEDMKYQTYSTSFSIDDVITRENIGFTGICLPWKKLLEK